MEALLDPDDTTSDLLAAVRTSRAVAEQADRDVLIAAARFAALHSVDSPQKSARLDGDVFGDRMLPLAGPGAPLVSEAAAVEFSAVLGRSTHAGKKFLGDAVELRYRLKHVWARILDGSLLAWRARRIADLTRPLDREVATWVDKQIGPYAHTMGPVQLERAFTQAAALFEPDVAAAAAESEAVEHRSVTITTHETTPFVGTGAEQGQAVLALGYLDGVLDAADALDLEQAVASIARGLLDEDDYAHASLDVRRAAALGVLGRAYNSGSFDGVPGVTRVVELVIHTDTRDLAGTGLVRLTNTCGLVTIERLEQWATTPGTIVKPVIVVDLADTIEAAGYVPTARQRRQAELIHEKCSFPYCQARAERCDLDHRVPYAAGGETSSHNLTPLCRQHHRMKTHHGWRYHRIRAGTYRWRSPHGYEYVVTPAGTIDISEDLGPPLTLAA
ncbi:HNH endonuclease [Nocardioides sp. NPDC057772]|uniref:HNH endonuclease signature motif containing protein n=1 Tax=Nocardioides sp. NPDC057772 TaxID=3346245 RepID=UPI003672E853